jgi:hypothetical protein
LRNDACLLSVNHINQSLSQSGEQSRAQYSTAQFSKYQLRTPHSTSQNTIEYRTSRRSTTRHIVFHHHTLYNTHYCSTQHNTTQHSAVQYRTYSSCSYGTSQAMSGGVCPSHTLPLCTPRSELPCDLRLAPLRLLPLASHPYVKTDKK